MVQDVAGEAKTTNTDKARAIEDLLIGSGGEAFREIERRIFRFCPFEAIGMVRQEIRHARFLSFILDPNRPHPFHDHLLKVFLQVVLGQAQQGQINLHPLTVHCSDYSDALIYRERDNIDIMIEVPASSRNAGKKGLVIAVELKVDAAESTHQLGKYRQQVLAGYSAEKWDHAFVFLTKDESAPSEPNMGTWIPVGLISVIDRFDQEVEARGLVGEAVDLYRKYSSMIRRNLVDDDELITLAKSIWGKHKEALEVLYDYRPDLLSEVMGCLSDSSENLIESVKKETGFTLSPDTSTQRILRYSVNEWQNIPGFRDDEKNWVGTGSLMVLELQEWGKGGLRVSFVLGPGDVDIREKIYKEVLRLVDEGRARIGRRTAKIGPFKHLSASEVLTSKEYAKAETDGESAQALGEKVIARMIPFLKGHLDIYDKALRKALAE